MESDIEQAIREYHELLDRTLKPKKALEAKKYDNWFRYYFEKASAKADELRPGYDLGFAITSHGLWLGYLFEKAGLPVQIAHAKRKGRGTQIKFDDDFSTENLRSQRIILLDDAIETGRTLRAVANSIRVYGPETIDALVYSSSQKVSLQRYEQIRRYGIPEGTVIPPHLGHVWIMAKDFVIEGVDRIMTLD